jgi:hypothetical protein
MSAAEWLRDFLADGEAHVTAGVFEAAAKARAGDRTTLWRAARSLGVVKGRTVEFPSVGTRTLPNVSEQNPVTERVSEPKPNLLDEAQPLHSRCEDRINETTATAEAGQAQETIILQGFRQSLHHPVPRLSTMSPLPPR